MPISPYFAGMDLQGCDVDTKWGKQALRSIYAAIFWRQRFGPFQARHDAFVAGADGTGGAAGRDARAVESTRFVQWFQQAADMERELRGVGITSADADKGNVKKFLNRLLGLRVQWQNMLFDFFTASLEYTVETAKREGKFDQGVADIRAESMEVVRQTVFMENAGSAVRCMHHVVELDRGTPSCVRHSLPRCSC